MGYFGVFWNTGLLVSPNLYRGRSQHKDCWEIPVGKPTALLGLHGLAARAAVSQSQLYSCLLFKDELVPLELICYSQAGSTLWCVSGLQVTEIDKQIDKQLQDRMKEYWVVSEREKPESGDKRHCALTTGMKVKVRSRGRERERDQQPGLVGEGRAVVRLQGRERLS